VVVTRTREQSNALAAPLEALGAQVIACPVIAIVEPPDAEPVTAAIDALGSYDWIVLTSTNAVDRFFDRVAAAEGGAEALDRVKLAAVGSATAARMRKRGLVPDLVPEEFRAEGLAEAFCAMGAGPGWRVLLPRALEGRDVIPDELREVGAQVDVVAVYRTVPAEPDPAVVARLRDGHVDAVTFTSPSTVRNFLDLLRRAGLDPATTLGGVALASIGPVTTDALLDAGLEATVEAAPSTVEALVEALVGYLGRRV
jgi:uroporphyrinogen III methyltransferase/synthase